MILKLSLSDDVAARLDSARGLHSRQEFVTNALISALEGSDAEQELRAALLHLLTNDNRVSSPTLAEETQLTW
jgi:metal-responsive CopG/Arc/MetJ family transcriptional regulator